MNNRVEPDESVEVNSNTTRLRAIYEHFQKRKLIWIIFFIVLIVVIILVSTITATMKKTKREKPSTTTTTEESTMEGIITSELLTTTNEQFDSSVMIDNNTKWKQNASTVAGGNMPGSGINQLNGPQGIYIDNDDQSIYIADTGNYRIVRWKLGANNGEMVAGGNGPGPETNQLSMPVDVLLDKHKKYLIICDALINQRVMRWYRQNNPDPEILISHIACWGLAIDNNGDLYISDQGKHQVIRWREGDKEGTVVAGGHEPGNRFDQLTQPMYIFVDKYHSVYIADSMNNRVMKWKKNATEGSLVAPGQVSNVNPNSLVQPISVIVDQMGNAYVSTFGNFQIMRWSPDATAGVPVAGEKIEVSGPTQFLMPNDLSFDRHGNLYVVDMAHGRIQKFDIDRG
ncbi:unnamed protein product [Adineta steineri]|uniref:NHL repeat containing protein n=1 Tax=Adineta steineri TaxID=433720 RepID=A0A815BLC2_9BILA|nr:unnamed protein product [Adineta steineri]CAF1559141.1 unnamed protein product [Adineta steineri]